MNIKRMLCIMLIFVAMTGNNAFANDIGDNYLNSINKEEIRTGSINGEWLILAMARGGIDSGFDTYYSELCNVLRENNGDLGRKYTEYSRVIIALTALGKNPYDVGGYDLVSKLEEYDRVISQGLNGAVFAVIATKCGGYKNVECENYLDYILSKQNSDGSFSLSGEGDIDVTAMAIQALSFYDYRENVNNSINRALNWLKGRESENAEGYAQMLIAYTGAKSVNKGEIDRVYNELMGFACDSGFCHIKEQGYNQMASEQACCAIVAYERYLRGEKNFYNINNNKSIFYKVG